MSITQITNILTHKKLNNLWFFSLSVISFFLIILPYIPSYKAMQLVEYALYLSPRWMFLFLLIPALFFWKNLGKYRRLFLLIYAIIFIQFQDVQLNMPAEPQTISSIKLMSLNTGGGSSSKYLKKMVQNENPDVFLFQETLIENLKGVFEEPWQHQCDGGLCIASKYPFNKIGEFSRGMFKGWGNFAAYYELDIGGKTLPIMNVHLETPRSILSDLLGLTVNWDEVQKLRDNKTLEASLISQWASTQAGFVLAGDFNMTTNESLYKDYFSSFQNTLDTVGLGVNFTKYTSWHGVRIDHVLTSNNIMIEEASVMPSLGGDHRAIVTILALPY